MQRVRRDMPYGKKRKDKKMSKTALHFNDTEDIEGYFNGCDLVDTPIDCKCKKEKPKKTLKDRFKEIDWNKVNDNFIKASFGIGQILGYLIHILAKVIFSAVFVFALGEIAPELKQQVPSLYWFVDMLIKFSENLFHECLMFVYHFF